MQKVSYFVFFIDLYFDTFCDEINFENFKISPKNKHKEGKYKTSIPMKFSSKFRLSTYVEKNINFSYCFKLFWGGVTKFEALQKAFVTKLNPPKPSPHTRKPTCTEIHTTMHVFQLVKETCQ
jgi:hypothetical protein